MRLNSGRLPGTWSDTERGKVHMQDGKRSALVLISGGLDSTVACAMAREEYKLKIGLFFDYGQRALERERESAERIAEFFGMEFVEINLDWMKRYSSSIIVGGSGRSDDFPSSWVENRNGIFINVAASIAVEIGCEVVVVGFNREEAIDFPDNSAEYLDSVNEALKLGVSKPIFVVSPTLHLNKKEIVKRGIELGIPWESLWSCYEAGDRMCGHCDSCRRLKEAVSGTGAQDKVIFK